MIFELGSSELAQRQCVTHSLRTHPYAASMRLCCCLWYIFWVRL